MSIKFEEICVKATFEEVYNALKQVDYSGITDIEVADSDYRRIDAEYIMEMLNEAKREHMKNVWFPLKANDLLVAACDLKANEVFIADCFYVSECLSK